MAAANPVGTGPASAPSSPVTPTGSASLVINGGFESGLTAWTASGTTVIPTVSTANPHTGSDSALLGLLSGSAPAGDSSLVQTVTVPASGTTALTFWYYPQTADSLCSGSGCVYDWEEAQVRSAAGTTLASIFKSNSNSKTWTKVSYDLTPYAGQTVQLWFNVHQDQSVPPDDSSMYLDDVSVDSSQTAPPTVPAAPTGVTATAGNASATVSWTAPANGGSAITSYTVTPRIGGAAQTPVTVGSTATSATVTGLTNGTSYTFTVTATNAVGTGPASAASTAVTPVAPTVPGAPTGVTATAGSGSASVSWTAPSNGGSAITSYSVTPYLSGVAQAATTVTGTPPATTATVTGLTNGQSYTFTVSAANVIGTGAASASSNAVTPTVAAASAAFVQQVAAHSPGATSLLVTPSTAVTTGNRLVVLAGIWASGGPTAKTVTDSAGDTYTEVLHFKASDGTEMSVWTAPITAGGSKPTITVTPTAKADIGVEALEYSGLSTAAGTAAVDQLAYTSGTTGASAATVQSGATPATTAANELALGFYAGLGIRGHPDPGHRVQPARQRVAAGRHGIPHRGCRGGTRRDAFGGRRNGLLDRLADGHGGVQAVARLATNGVRSARNISGRPDAVSQKQSAAEEDAQKGKSLKRWRSAKTLPVQLSSANAAAWADAQSSTSKARCQKRRPECVPPVGFEPTLRPF